MGFSDLNKPFFSSQPLHRRCRRLSPASCTSAQLASYRAHNGTPCLRTKPGCHGGLSSALQVCSSPLLLPSLAAAALPPLSLYGLLAAGLPRCCGPPLLLLASPTADASPTAAVSCYCCPAPLPCFCCPPLWLMPSLADVASPCCCWPPLLLLASTVVAGLHCCCWPSLLLLASPAVVGLPGCCCCPPLRLPPSPVVVCLPCYWWPPLLLCLALLFRPHLFLLLSPVVGLFSTF